MDERRVLHDDGVGLGDRLPHADRLVVHSAERNDRRSCALGAEGREGLGLSSFEERGHREQLGCRDDALATASVDPNLEHAGTFVVAGVHAIRALTGCPSVLARTARSAMLHLE